MRLPLEVSKEAVAMSLEAQIIIILLLEGAFTMISVREYEHNASSPEVSESPCANSPEEVQASHDVVRWTYPGSGDSETFSQCLDSVSTCGCTESCTDGHTVASDITRYVPIFALPNIDQRLIVWAVLKEEHLH